MSVRAIETAKPDPHIQDAAPSSWMGAMRVEQKPDRLVITIDTSEAARVAAPLSKTQKTRVVATTHGFLNYGDVQLSVNCTCRS